MFIFIMMTLFLFIKKSGNPDKQHNMMNEVENSSLERNITAAHPIAAAVFHRNLTGKFFIIAGSAPLL